MGVLCENAVWDDDCRMECTRAGPPRSQHSINVCVLLVTKQGDDSVQVARVEVVDCLYKM